MFTYRQIDGRIDRNGAMLCIGYSGSGEGKNNPELQNIHDVGPLPRGKYKMEIISEHGTPCEYEGKMPPVIRLIPDASNEMFGRAGFLIHGDFIDPGKRGTASHGCIVVDHYDRVWICERIEDGDSDLEVV